MRPKCVFPCSKVDFFPNHFVYVQLLLS